MVTLEFHIGSDPVIRVLIEEHSATEAVDSLNEFVKAMGEHKDEMFEFPDVGVGEN